MADLPLFSNEMGWNRNEPIDKKREGRWAWPFGVERNCQRMNRIAMLDATNSLADAPQIWRNIHQKQGFMPIQLRSAVQQAALLLELPRDRKFLGTCEKTSWKRVFGKAPKKLPTAKRK